MNKQEAVKRMVDAMFSPIPTEWVQIVAERYSEFPNLPMWGTMFQMDNHIAEKLVSKSSYMEQETVGEDEYEEEMEGCLWLRGTAGYIYEIDGRWVIGVHGAGWNFYDGFWDRVYDALELEWHEV